MDKENKYFYISGLLSFSLFTLVILLFIMLLFKPSKSNTFGLKKENYISISLEVPKIVSSKQKKQVKMAKVSESVESEIENIDVNNLFSDVWTKKITAKKEKPKPQNTRRILEIQKQLKTTHSNKVDSIAEKVNNLDSVKTKSESDTTSTANQVNEYLAKIQAIVYQYFHVPPNSAGNSVKTVIELNALGKVLDFRVLSYSANDRLNAEVDKIKERIRHVVFPVNPQNSSSRTVVILISKE